MTLLAIINPDGPGNMALIDLPAPMEPVFVDLDKPLEDQLFGNYLIAARKILDE